MSFQTGAGPDGEVKALVLQKDGRILVGGQFSQYDDAAVPGLMRLGRDGRIDSTFDAAKSLAAPSSISALAFLSDGRILVAGELTNVLGAALPGIVRLFPDGTFDSSFYPVGPSWTQGEVPRGGIRALALQSDGKILVAGECMRLHPDGSQDTSFRPQLLSFPELSGFQWPGWVYSISELPDHKVLVAGNIQQGVARLNGDGTVDNTFQSHPPRAAYAAVQPAGKILVSGGPYLNGLARLHPDGSIDATFQVGAGLGGVVYAAENQWAGKIVVAGSFTHYNDTARRNIARLNTDGSLDESFDAAVGLFDGKSKVNALALEPDGDVVVGGLFSLVNGIARANLVRLHGGLPAGAPAIIVQPLSRTNMAGQSLRFSVSALSVEPPAYQWRFEGSDLPGETNDVLSLTNVQTSQAGKYSVNVQNSLGSSVSAEAALTVLNLAAPLIVSQPAEQQVREGETATFRVSVTSFLPVFYQWQFNGRDLVGATNSSLNLTNVHVREGGDYSVMVRHELLSTNSAVARLTVEPSTQRPGAVDIDFAPDLSSEPPLVKGVEVLSTILLDDDNGLFAGGRIGLVRLDRKGALDSTFNPQFEPAWFSFMGGPLNPVRIIMALAWDKDGKLLVGGAFSAVNGISYRCIVRLNPDGSVDPTFAPDTGVDGAPGGIGYSYIDQIATQGNGQILLSGFFARVNGTFRAYYARLNRDGSLDASFVSPLEPGFGAFKAVSLADGKTLLAAVGQPGAAARLNLNGTLDEGFNPRLRARAADRLITTLAATPNGGVVLGGYFSEVDGQPRQGVARLLPNGEVDPGFNPGEGPSGPVKALAVARDGKVIVAGDFLSFGGLPRRFLTRLKPDGTVDPTFNPAVFDSGETNVPKSLLLTDDGKVIVAGQFQRVAGIPRHYLARLHGDPVIRFRTLRRDHSTYDFAISTAVGNRYTMDSTDSLFPLNWTPVLTVAGDGSIQSLTDTNATGPQRFYRLRIESSPP